MQIKDTMRMFKCFLRRHKWVQPDGFGSVYCERCGVDFMYWVDKYVFIEEDVDIFISSGTGPVSGKSKAGGKTTGGKSVGKAKGEPGSRGKSKGKEQGKGHSKGKGKGHDKHGCN